MGSAKGLTYSDGVPVHLLAHAATPPAVGKPYVARDSTLPEKFLVSITTTPHGPITTWSMLPQRRSGCISGGVVGRARSMGLAKRVREGSLSAAVHSGESEVDMSDIVPRWTSALDLPLSRRDLLKAGASAALLRPDVRRAHRSLLLCPRSFRPAAALRPWTRTSRVRTRRHTRASGRVRPTHQPARVVISAARARRTPSCLRRSVPRLEIVLSEAPTTGQAWRVIASGEPICRLEDDAFVAPSTAAPGEPKQHTFVFRTIAGTGGDRASLLERARGEPARSAVPRLGLGRIATVAAATSRCRCYFRRMERQSSVGGPVVVCPGFEFNVDTSGSDGCAS